MLEPYDNIYSVYDEISSINKDINENKKKLLNIIKKKLGISDDDMKSIDIVSRKIRDSNINDILSND